MPRLSEIGNSDAVDSAYASRAIVYVEAPADSDVFTRMVGMAYAHKVDFKAPRAFGGGCQAVCVQVREERGKGNYQVFGLIDGESASSFGCLDDLIAATGTIFSLSSNDGVFCLATHELENLLLLYGDICEFIVNDVNLGNLSTRSRAEVEATLRRFAQRFFHAAILKYAALHLGNSGKVYPTVDIGRFQQRDASTKSIRTDLRKEIVDAGLDWHVFSGQVVAIMCAVRSRIRDENVSNEVRSFHMIRLADGKGLMNRMRQHYRASLTIEGHLVRRLVNSTYAREFRDEILMVVGS
ncbi:MAG: hypothetical protein OXN89_23815 [Bryobacterales bacterium]|nr:hypothetical protein [Bryobacterales bacterium]